MVKILFVCMGNICRSPTAEGVFRHKISEHGLEDKVHIDSAGTHAYHVGNPPDDRAQSAALKRGFDLSTQRARRVSSEDFEHFDYVIAMDVDNQYDLKAICPAGHEERLHLFLNFSENYEQHEVPDPYYGGGKGFEIVLDLIEDASEGLIEHLKVKKLV
jgi:protein-tyrosine phosphatase